MLSSHDFDNLNNQIHQLTFDLKEKINRIESDEGKKKELANFHLKAHALLEKDLSPKEAKELFLVISLSFSDNIKISLTYLDQYYAKSKSSANFILVMSYILYKISKAKAQLPYKCYTYIDEALTELLPQIRNKNQNWTLFKHEILPQFQNEFLINILYSSKMTEKIFNDFLRFVFLRNLHSNYNPYKYFIDKIARTVDFIKYSPLSKSSNEEILEFIKNQNFEILNRISNDTFKIFASAFIFVDSLRIISKETLNGEMAFQLIALTWIISKEKKSKKFASSLELEEIILKTTESLIPNCEPAIYESFKILIDNYVTPSMYHIKFINLGVPFILKSINVIKHDDNFLKSNFITFIRMITYIIIYKKIDSFDYNMRKEIFNILISNVDEIIELPCFYIKDMILFFFFDQEIFNEYFFSLQKSSDIIKFILLKERYANDNIINDEKIHDFLMPFLVELEKEKNWKDFLIISRFLNRQDPSKKIDLELPKTIKYLVSKDCEIKDYTLEETIEIISMQNDVKLSDETFYNIFEQMMKDKEISYAYFDYLVNAYFDNEYIYTYDNFLPIILTQFKSYPDDLFAAIKRNYYYNGKYLYRKNDKKLSTCPISKFGVSIIDKLFESFEKNPLSFQVLLILKNIASTFPFLFKDYFQKIIDTVLPLLNCISIPLKRMKMKNQIENIKTTLSAISFLFSSLAAPFALDNFFNWLFSNILTLTNEQVSCFMMILQNIFANPTLSISSFVYCIKYNFIEIVSKLLERDIQTKSIRKFYRNQIYLFLEQFYDAINKFEAESTIQMEEYQKIEYSFNYFFDFISTSFPEFMKLDINSKTSFSNNNIISPFINNIDDVQPYWPYKSFYLSEGDYDYDYDLFTSQQESFLQMLDEIKLPEINDYSYKNQFDVITKKIYRYLCMNRSIIYVWTLRNDSSIPLVSPLLDELKKVEETLIQMENDCKEHPEDKDNESISIIDVDEKLSFGYSRTLFTIIINQIIDLKLQKFNSNDNILSKIQELICEKEQGIVLYFDILSQYLSQIDKDDAFQIKEKISLIIKIFEKLSNDISSFNSYFVNSKCADKLIDLTLFFGFNGDEDFYVDVSKLFINFEKKCLPDKIIQLIRFLLFDVSNNHYFENAIKLYQKLNEDQLVLIDQKIQNEMNKIIKNGSLEENFITLLQYMEGFIEKYMKEIIDIVNKCQDEDKIKAIDAIIRYLASKNEENKLAYTYIKEAFHDYWNLYENNIDMVIKMIDETPSILDFYKSIIEFPEFIKFDTRYSYFRDKMEKSINNEDFIISFEIDRNNILEGSLEQLGEADPLQLKHKIVVDFANEPVEDEGGGKREWFELLIKEIFNYKNNLFECSKNNKSYQPSHLSSSNPEKYKYFYFSGQIIARGLMEGLCISCHLSRSFIKQILHQEPNFDDLEDFDQELYQGLKWMINNDVSSLNLFFAIENEQHQLIPLKENGEIIEVNNENKIEYIDLYSNFILKKQIKNQIDNFIDGFYSLIDSNVIKFFNYEELDSILFGMPKIDINDFKQNVKFIEPYTDDTPVIKLFFNVIEKWSNEDLEKLLLFMTGSSRIPVNGFKEFCLLTENKLTIQPGGDQSLLPQAHTCFNILCLPQYETEEEMNNKLHMAIQLCNTFELI